jgi:hypothetical protein
MFFSLICLILVGVIAFFHYTQGFWSATLSAILTILAAALAVGYHESVVVAVLQGQVGDQANAIALVGLFALIYLVLRIVFDTLIPGNIRFPLIADKVGAGVMGFVAALFSVGVVAIAAQTLPFGPDVGGYARRALGDARDVQMTVPGFRTQQDIQVVNELDADSLDEGATKKLLLPVDDLVINTVARLSDGGSLAGTRSLESVHPAYLDELFAQRIGVQVGAKRTASNLGAKEQVTVAGVARLEQVTPVDAETSPIRSRPLNVPNRPGPNQAFLVVRAMFTRDAADSDGFFRFSPGAIRLTSRTEDGWVNYHPIGTLEGGNTLVANRPDDHVFVNVKAADQGADLVFLVDRSATLVGEGADQKVADGVVLEVKRLARVDLSGQAVTGGLPPSPNVSVLRKPHVAKAAPAAAAPAAPAAAAGGTAAAAGATQAGPISISNMQASPRLFTPLNVGTPQFDANNQQLVQGSGTVSLTERKISKLEVNPTATIGLLSRGDQLVDELYAPEGQRVVQVAARAGEGGEAWAWAEGLGEFQLKDAAGKTYPAAGAWARVQQQNQEKLVGAYDARGATPSIGREEGDPQDVWLAFVVPAGTPVKQLLYRGQPVHNQDLQVQ